MSLKTQTYFSKSTVSARIMYICADVCLKLFLKPWAKPSSKKIHASALFCQLFDIQAFWLVHETGASLYCALLEDYDSHHEKCLIIVNAINTICMQGDVEASTI